MTRHIVALALAFVLAGPAAAQPVPDPSRIVAVGGTVTEIVYALGGADRLVGLDTTSLYPPEALQTKPNVGYARALSAEGILSLKPTLVLAIEGAGPPAVLAQVAEAGVAVRRIPEPYDADGVLARIAAVGTIIGRAEAAKSLEADVAARFAALSVLRARVGKPIKALLILTFRDGRAMVGGRGTAADAMLHLAGAENAAGAMGGYKAMTDEAVIAAAPDALVMMDTGTAKPADVLAAPAFAATPAGKTGAIRVMDGQSLLGFGPRTPDAARDLLLDFYPQLADPAR